MQTKNRSIAIQQRNSGIELLKIIGILLIIISHSVGTLYYLEEHNIKNIFNLMFATINPEIFSLKIFLKFGTIGNIIFFTSSAYFLCDSKGLNVKKVINMLIDVWLISIINLGVFVVLNEKLSFELIIKSIFPTTFGNNWYITCYLLVFMIHPFLNIIIINITQKQHLVFVVTTFILYCGVAFLKHSSFWYNDLLLFIILYFFVSYIKMYFQHLSINIKLNMVLILIGMGGMFIFTFLINYLGLHFDFFSQNSLYWNTNNNPFIILLVIGAFNIFSQIDFFSRTINQISSVSLFVYIIHENLLVRTYFRPNVYVYIFNTYGSSYIIIWILVFAIALLVITTLLSIIYKYTIHKIAIRVSNIIYENGTKICQPIMNNILKLK